MSLKFLLDEDHLDLAGVIERWNASAEHHIDLVSVGDETGPSRGTRDNELLIWAEEHGRILITGQIDIAHVVGLSSTRRAHVTRRFHAEDECRTARDS